MNKRFAHWLVVLVMAALAMVAAPLGARLALAEPSEPTQEAQALPDEKAAPDTDSQAAEEAAEQNQAPALDDEPEEEEEDPQALAANYTLTFNDNGGSGGPGSLTASDSRWIPVSHTFTIPDTVPTRDGYEFAGWGETRLIATHQPGGNVTVIGGSMTLYAVWNRIYTYTLNYHASTTDAVTNMPEQQVEQSTDGLNHKFTISSLTPSRENYDFLGWSETEGATSPKYQPGDETDASSALTPTKDLYAVWREKTKINYTLKFDANGGSLGDVPSQDGPYESYESSYSFTIPTDEPTYDATHRFLGWSEDSEATSAQYQPGDTYTASATASSTSVTKTLYAVWERVYNYVLKFDAPAWTGAPETITEQSTSWLLHTVAIPNVTPSVTGWSFMGWAITSDATVPIYQPGGTYVFTNPLRRDTVEATLYPVWAKEALYRVKFEANGGTGAPADLSYGPSTDLIHTFTLPTQEPTKEGYLFRYWLDTNSTVYRPGQTVVLENIANPFDPSDRQTALVQLTLYASYEDAYEITYRSADTSMGTVSLDSEIAGRYSWNVQGSTAVPEPGYKLVNWTRRIGLIDLPVSTSETFVPTVKASADYTAHFTVRDDTPYTVEWYYMQDDGTYSATPDKSETRQGTTNAFVETTTADRRTEKDGWVFDNTNASNVQRGYIAGDGSLTLKLFFKMSLDVTYTDGLDGAIFDEQVTRYINYGSNTPAFRGSTDRAGYDFLGWTKASDPDAAPGEVDAKVTRNETYTAAWEPRTDTPYTVETYYQVDGAYPTEPDTSETREGTTDTTVAVTNDDKEPTKDGYVLDDAAGNVFEGNVAGDGSLVLKVFFKQQFSVTYKDGLDGAAFDDQVSGNLDYGVETPAFEGAPERAGYTFAGWDPEVADTVSADATYTAT